MKNRIFINILFMINSRYGDEIQKKKVSLFFPFDSVVRHSTQRKKKNMENYQLLKKACGRLTAVS